MVDSPSTSPWSACLDRGVLLVAGKGGVGRTTLTASMARSAARAGRRVLVTEIGEPDGDYSPLARLYGRDSLPPRPETIEPGVKGCLLWSRAGHSLFLERVLPVPALVRAGMRSKSLGRLLDAAPSFNEMGVFYRLLSLIVAQRDDGSPEHELILLDLPATGHSLALTGLPEILLRLMPTGPIAELMREGQSYLYDPEHTAACVVTLPETLPVTECLELIEGLRETRIPVGMVVVNKVIEDRFDDAERALLDELIDGRQLFGTNRYHTMAQIEQSIERLEQRADHPLMTVPEFARVGDALLDDICSSLLREGP